MLEYLSIFAAALCGFTGSPWWTAGLAAVALVTLSYARNYSLLQRGAAQGLGRITGYALAASTANAIASCLMAYIAGLVMRLLA